jgi:hypothetical protein
MAIAFKITAKTFGARPKADSGIIDMAHLSALLSEIRPRGLF